MEIGFSTDRSCNSRDFCKFGKFLMIVCFLLIISCFIYFCKQIIIPFFGRICLIKYIVLSFFCCCCFFVFFMKVRSIMRKEMDKAGVKDPQVLDKSYWIQRVGEVCFVTEQALPLT